MRLERYRTRTLLLIALLASSGLAVATPLAPVATATASCGAFGNNYFDGTRTYTPVYYISGTIVDRAVLTCSNTSGVRSGASAWIMIAGGGSNQYAQIGFAKIAGMSATQTFTEYNDGTSTPPGWNRTFWPGIWSPFSTTHSYIVSFSYSTGHVSMTVDGSTKATTPWGADTTWSPGWTGQVFGETLNLGDDIPGTASAKTNFASIQVITCRSCSLSNPSWAIPLGSAASYYKYEWVSNPTAFNVWTQR